MVIDSTLGVFICFIILDSFNKIAEYYKMDVIINLKKYLKSGNYITKIQVSVDEDEDEEIMED